MSDKPSWTHAITGAIERLAGVFERQNSQKLYSKKESRRVRDTLNKSNPDNIATSFSATTEILDKLHPKHRSSVIDSAIERIGAKGPLDTFAVTTIVSARNHLLSKQVSKLKRMVPHKPELNESINKEINDLPANLADSAALKTAREFNEDAKRGNISNDPKAAERQLEEYKDRAALKEYNRGRGDRER